MDVPYFFANFVSHKMKQNLFSLMIPESLGTRRNKNSKKNMKNQKDHGIKVFTRDAPDFAGFLPTCRVNLLESRVITP